MTVGIRIVGLAKAQRMLGQDFQPAIKAATKAIALEVQGVIAPYPPATIANSPENPMLRWYERGYGPRWWVAGEGAQGYLMRFSKRQRKRMAQGFGRQELSRRVVLSQARKGRIHGQKTSQMMNRGWSVKATGRTGYVVGNRATYSGYLHSADLQANWAAERGWITDEQAVDVVVGSGAARRIVVQAIMARMRRR